jgi:molecular chaperone DnaK
MEAVALGAAIQGGVLSGDVKQEILLLDVTPLTLGVETKGGIMTPIVERNATIPTERTQTFTTAEDFQTAVTIHVVQGERKLVADNISLGVFNLTGLPPAPKGVPQIQVKYALDASGLLNVTAKDLGSGKEAKITISASTKLSKEEKEKMVKQAEEFAEQDKKKLEEVELLNEADSMLYTAERTKTDLAGKIAQPDVDKIDAAAKELRQAIEAKQNDAIKAKTEALKNVLQQVGTAVYQQAATQQQAAQGPQPQAQPQSEAQAGPDGNANVTDAEYKVVDEEKKQ